MKTALLQQHGSLENLTVGKIEKPKPGAGQVLVHTRAAALNHLDLFVVKGIPGVEIPMPHIPGADGAGDVVSSGAGCKRFKKSDRVMLNACLWCGQCEFCIAGEQSLCVDLRLMGEHQAGTLAEYFVAPETSLEKIPEGIDYETAAAFSLVFQTAWRMLVSQGALKAGEDVFIHGIGGGVSLAALQIAKLAGARVFVSSSSNEKLERAAQLGADFTYNYNDLDVVREVGKATNRRGVDLVVDNVGAATWLQSLKIARKGGRVVNCGATSGPNPRTEIRLIFWKQLHIIGSTMSNAAEYRNLIQLLGQGKLTPVIDQVFPLDDIAAAYKRLEKAQQFGKIVIRTRA